MTIILRIAAFELHPGGDGVETLCSIFVVPIGTGCLQFTAMSFEAQMPPVHRVTTGNRTNRNGSVRRTIAGRTAATGVGAADVAAGIATNWYGNGGATHTAGITPGDDGMLFIPMHAFA